MVDGSREAREVMMDWQRMRAGEWIADEKLWMLDMASRGAWAGSKSKRSTEHLLHLCERSLDSHSYAMAMASAFCGWPWALIRWAGGVSAQSPGTSRVSADRAYLPVYAVDIICITR